VLELIKPRVTATRVLLGTWCAPAWFGCAHWVAYHHFWCLAACLLLLMCAGLDCAACCIIARCPSHIVSCLEYCHTLMQVVL
jgi:hypothetical protein